MLLDHMTLFCVQALRDYFEARSLEPDPPPLAGPLTDWLNVELSLAAGWELDDELVEGAMRLRHEDEALASWLEELLADPPEGLPIEPLRRLHAFATDPAELGEEFDVDDVDPDELVDEEVDG